MDVVLWLLFLFAVGLFLAIGHFLKNVVLISFAAILLIVISIFLLSGGLQINDGEITVFGENTQTLTYTFSELVFGGIAIGPYMAAIGILLGFLILLLLFAAVFS